MNIAVPSRFACLKIEDDDRKSTVEKTDTKNKSNDNNNTKLSNTKKANNKKKGATNQQTTSNNKKNSTSSKNSKKNKQLDKQWEDWKKMDRELVTENFEQDLRNAILQSKLDYEAQKKSNGDLKSNRNSTQSTNTNNKKKKHKTMSLNQFLENSEQKKKESGEKLNNEAFFDKLMEIAKLEVRKGIVEEERREREVDVQKLVTIAQYQERLKEERAHSANLQKQLDVANAEIADIKARNKTLCGILGQGEMKEKADILLELVRVNIDKDDLTEEISRLNKLLEQERSKSVNLTETQLLTNAFKNKEQKENKKTKKKSR